MKLTSFQPVVSDLMSLENRYDLIEGENFVLNSNLAKYYHENIHMSSNKIIELSQKTIFQSKTVMWFDVRRLRISPANHCGSADCR